ncbi:SAM-dependent methyltransferase [Kitasatospora sp. NPDC097605]|uniref:SAM-dependent methyltransferase n=1 Tax=Kitasatospora sp. NPDC097605 TaxID=3157226 RepID=UPI003330216D
MTSAHALSGLIAGVDPEVPHVSRVLDLLLGGTANYPADRAAAEHASAARRGGDVRVDVRAARGALVRMVRYLAAEAGVRQFLDIGSGLPTMDNTHEAARRIVPDARTVYVDNDSVVVAHARRLLAGLPRDEVRYLHGDLREIDRILDAARSVLDFERPVGVILFGILQYVPDDQGPAGLLKRIVDAVPPGSHVAFSQPARAGADEDAVTGAAFDLLERPWGEPVVRRTRQETADLCFAGLEPVEPGLAELPDWRPEPGAAGPRPLPAWCGLAHKA